MPGAGLHRQLGVVEQTGILGGIPRRRPDVLLTGEQHRLAYRPVILVFALVVIGA